MGYLDAFTIIENTFKGAIVITRGSQINQSGTYLFFDGSVANNKVEDTLSFTVAIAAHSLTKENGVMGEVDKLRKKALDSKWEIDFKRSKGVDFETSSLYIVALEFTIKINLKEDYES